MLIQLPFRVIRSGATSFRHFKTSLMDITNAVLQGTSVCGGSPIQPFLWEQVTLVNDSNDRPLTQRTDKLPLNP